MRYDVTPGRNTNLWGLPPPRTWFEETTPLVGARVIKPAVEGEPFSLEKYLFSKRPQAAGGGVGRGARRISSCKATPLPCSLWRR